MRPGKDRETQVDSGGIESVDRIVEFDAKVLVQIKTAGDVDERLREVGIDVSPGVVEVVLVSPIDAADVGQRIRDFAFKIRTAASIIMGVPNFSATDNIQRKSRPRVSARLRSYFKEFSGKKTCRRRSEVTMDCIHGDIVGAPQEKYQFHKYLRSM